MINFNGEIIPNQEHVLANNRAFLYGDAVFETLKIVNNKILFLEDHYFRLMASMRILRMEIPMSFTMEFIEAEILKLLESTHFSSSARVRFSVFRNQGGYYAPLDNSVSYLINASALKNQLYEFDGSAYEVDLYKDFYISKQLLSNIKSTNKIINITGSIFAQENDLKNCFLINEDKNVVEALNGNVFMLFENKLITPPITEGCLNGIMRKKVIELAQKQAQYEVVEKPISPFDLQKANELFITNTIIGIKPITKYRKKEYSSTYSNTLLNLLNDAVKEESGIN
jgi:branched-chain amino acid aminotransferase